MIDRLPLLAVSLPPHTLPPPEYRVLLEQGRYTEQETFDHLQWRAWSRGSPGEAPARETGAEPVASSGWAAPFPAPGLLDSTGDLPDRALAGLTVVADGEPFQFTRYPDETVHPPGYWGCRDGLLVLLTTTGPPRSVRFEKVLSREDLAPWHYALWDGEDDAFLHRKIDIDGSLRDALYLPAPGRVEDRLTIPHAARLETAAGLPSSLRVAPSPPIVFSGRFQETGSGETHVLFERRLDPRVPADRAWHDISVGLEPLAGKTGILSLETRTAGNRESGGPAAFAHPRIFSGDRPTRPLNLLLVVIDTLRADHVSGDRGATLAPVMSRLAREGVRFEDTASPSSWTGPAMGSLFSGLYPTVFGHGRDLFYGQPPATFLQVPRLAPELRSRGWTTWAFQTNPVLHGRGWAQGFDEYRYAFDALADTVTDAALEWIGRRGQEPFLAYVHYMDPHEPYRYHGPDADSVAPPGNPIARARAAYPTEVAFADKQLGRLVETMARRGMLDNTLITVLSDHGEELGERGNLGHGHSFHREVNQVVWILRPPDRVRTDAAGGLADDGASQATPPRHGGHWTCLGAGRTVSLVDVFPTLMHALGEDLVENFHGRDVCLEDPGERTLFSELVRRTSPQYAVVTQAWRYIHQQGRSDLLFDRTQDAGETRNLAGSSPKLVERLERAHQRHAEDCARRRRSLEQRASHSRAIESGIDRKTLEQLRALGYAE